MSHTIVCETKIPSKIQYNTVARHDQTYIRVRRSLIGNNSLRFKVLRAYVRVQTGVVFESVCLILFTVTVLVLVSTT